MDSLFRVSGLKLWYLFPRDTAHDARKIRLRARFSPVEMSFSSE